MPTFSHRTTLGLLELRPQEGGRYGLWLAGEPIGSYSTAAMAADDVAQRVTGSALDLNSLVPVPTDLTEWTKAGR